MQKSSAVQKFTKIVNSAAIRTFIDEETKTESKTVSPKSLSQICLLQKSVKAAPTKN